MKNLNNIVTTMALFLCFTSFSFAQGTVNGEKNGNGSIKKWHKIELELTGPNLSETASTFRNYRLDVTFRSPSNKVFKVPGFFDGDNDPANSGASSGNKWKARFTAGEEGTWTYSVSFVTGSDVAANLTGGRGGTAPDGESGSFTVGSQDKSGKDFRAKGKLEYVGNHYLQFDNGEDFIKLGANSPEVLMADVDFDGTTSVSNSAGNVNHSFQASEWNNGDPTWKDNRGRGIIGVVNYLSGLGVNSHYFLSMNILGDGKHTFPFIDENSPYTYDVSKLGQWELVFSQFDKMGLMIHFQTQENENMQYFENLEGGSNRTEFSIARKIYYRELVARFGHHMAITWNVGEENNASLSGSQPENTPAQRRAFAERLDDLAYYNDNIVIHDGAGQDSAIDIYQTGGLLGNTSYTGTSLQLRWNRENHDIFKYWYDQSAAAGKKWVISYDEPFANSNTDLTILRKGVIWSALTAGGQMEFYIGGRDINTNFDYSDYQDQWELIGQTADFMNGNLSREIHKMTPNDDLINGDNYATAEAGNTYLFYLVDGGNATVDLSAGSRKSFTVQWYDPRSGVTTNRSNVNGGSSNTDLGNPPNNVNDDWVILLKSTDNTSSNLPPVVSFNLPEQNAILIAPASVTVDVSASDSDGSISSVALFLNDVFVRNEGSAPYLWNDNDQDDVLSDLSNGTYTLKAVATDNDGATTTASRSFTVGSDANTPPTVSFTQPTAGTVLTAPARLSVNVAANDADGSIVSVELFINGVSIRSEVEIPYLWNNSNQDDELSNLSNGSYTLRAVATDDDGATTAVSRTFTVGIETPSVPPAVSFALPASGTVFTAPADVEVRVNAADADGSVTTVELFLDNVSIRSERVDPYRWNENDQDNMLSNLSAGTYTLRAVATDNDGLTSTTERSFTVGSATAAPIVSFTLPALRTVLKAPASLRVSVAASAQNATIASVDLYLNNVLLRSEVVIPYLWNNRGQDDALSGLSNGTYTLRAVATDDKGATSSAERTFTVSDSGVASLEGDTNAFALETAETVLFPNPVVTSVNVQLVTKGENVLLSIVDLNGRTLRHKNFKTQQGPNILATDIRDLTPGMYIVYISYDGRTESKKMLVE